MPIPLDRGPGTGPDGVGVAGRQRVRLIEGLLHEAMVPLLLVPAESDAMQAPSLVAAFSAADPALLRRPVLVPLDGSRFAEKALDLAKMLAGKVCGSLLLIEALPAPQDYLRPISLVGFALYLDFLDSEHPDEAAARYLSAHAHRSNLPIRAIETKVVTGRPAPVIVQCAARCNPGLIAMAAHARGGMTKKLLGSVTQQVLRGSAQPVLVAGPAVPLAS